MAKICKFYFENDSILHIEYNDGLTGELDLDKFASKPQYVKLQDPVFRKTAMIDKKSGDIVWEGCEPLCKNALYKQFELKSLMKRLKITDDML